MNILKVGGSMAVATGTGALIEQWLWRESLNPLMILLAFLVMMGLGVAWIWSRIGTARQGCFVHAVCEEQSKLARHAAEHVMLQSWVGERWPDSPVLPLRPVVATRTPSQPSDEQVAVQELAWRLLQQIGVTRDLAPGIRVATILPAGPPHRMAVAGAALAASLGLREVQFLSDNATLDKEPFVRFTIPSVPTRSSERSPGMTAILIPGENVEQSAIDALKREGLDVIPVGSIGTLTDSRAIEDRLSAVANVLKDVPKTDLLIVSSAPSAVAFAAGFLAAHMGFNVHSRPFAWLDDKHGHYDSAREVKAPEPLPSLPNDRPSTRRWWYVHLLASAMLLSVSATVLAASLGLGIEQGVNDATGTSIPYWSAWTGLVLGSLLLTSVFWAWNRWTLVELPAMPDWLRKRMCTVTIALGTSCRTTGLRHRRTDIGSFDTTEQAANEITDAFCSAVTALPAAMTWRVDITEATSVDDARKILTSREFGLDRTLRAQRLVEIVYGTEPVEYAKPRPVTDNAHVFKRQSTSSS